MTGTFPGLLNIWVVIALMMAGLFTVMANTNMVKKIIGLNIFQVSVFVFFITLGKVGDGTAPILEDRFETYSNPLPHVLILTAIVVGVATTALALALLVRIQDRFGTVDEAQIRQMDDTP